MRKDGWCVYSRFHDNEVLQSTVSILRKIGHGASENSLAIMTISLSVFITATFGLFLINAGDITEEWEDGVRVMVYLSDGLSPGQIKTTETELLKVAGVAEAAFISKAEALEFLKKNLKGQSSLLADLKENPLPDAFEIRLAASVTRISEIEASARHIHAVKNVKSVEYGQAWLERFANILRLFQFAVFGIAGLFFMASIFIIGNTIRLMLYSRREEIEIMHLVGASEEFIRKPFYVEGIVFSAIGGILGLTASYLGYLVISSSAIQEETAHFIQLRYFSPVICLIIILLSVFVGWLGCSISLSKFLKKY